jgi:ABC-type sugar transport system ATPase subunit
LGLSVRGAGKQQTEQRVRELAGWLGVAHLLERKPAGLSGGEAQRVALGRALAWGPGVLILDEPLSALDDETRRDMHAVLRRVKQLAGVTVLHVTHHREDAEALGDELWRMQDGMVRKE